MRTLFVNCYLQDAETRMPHYRRLIEQHSELVEVLYYELRPDYNLTRFDAVIFSGSQWMLTEREPSEDLAGFVRGLRIPTLGICFGHQLLARCFGAEIGRAERVERDEMIEIIEPWPLFSDIETEKSEVRSEIGNRKSAIVNPLVVMRESHQEFVTLESVRRIGWQLGARSESCPVEAIRHPSLPLYGIQFHPERSGPNGERLFQNFFRRVVSSFI